MVEFFNPQNSAEIKRKRMMAEQLKALSKPQETQVVSGIAIPNSPLSALAQAIGQVGATSQEMDAENIQSRDTMERQKFLADAIKNSGGDAGRLSEALLSNPSTMDTGLNLYSKNLESQRKEQLTPYQQESLMLRRDMMQQREDEKAAAVQAKIDEKNNKLTIGKQNFEDSLSNMAEKYKKLKEGGGVSSVKDSPISNFLTGIQTSGAGQAVGRMLGTENQSYRNQIAADIPLLTNAIKEATGMSAQQMNSNVELQTFLKALSNPENDYESNMAILANLSKKFGLGQVNPEFLGKNKPAQGGWSIEEIP